MTPAKRDGNGARSGTPLAGRTIAVTRAESAGDSLSDRLAALGATPVSWPAIVVTPPEDRRPLEDALDRISSFDWIVFTSPRAVDVVAEVAPPPGASPRVAAGGLSTASRLRSRGWPVHLVAERGGARALVAELLAAEVRDGDAILFPCSSRARDVLSRELRARGVSVHRVVAYATRMNTLDGNEVCAALESGSVDAVTFTSPSAVEAITRALGTQRMLLQGAKAFAIGPTTAAALRSAGVAPAGVAEPSTLDSLVESVVEGLIEPPGDADPPAAVDSSLALAARARSCIPGGVNSPVRAFGSVGGDPPFIERAAGSRLWDVDGNQYVDYVGSWGVAILGHSPPPVREAVIEAARRGTSFGAPTEREVELAEFVVSVVPSVDSVRLVNSGTEATMSAVRLARAATERSRIVKFRGGYHGHADLFLVEAGSGAATLGVPSSPGVTPGTTADTLVAEYNDLPSVEALLAAGGEEIAAVIVEPVAGNMGCVPPAPGFLAGLRALCSRHGALLIFDEVMTGFRVALGGAQERYDVRPDLTTFGKIIGGGIPVGAYGGRADLMRLVAPAGPVYQAGTLSGNPLATAAGLATLRILRADPGLYDRLETLGARLGDGLRTILEREGVAGTWNRVGSMFSLFFHEGPVTGWSTAAAADRQLFGRWFHGMLRRGIYLAPSPFEAGFVSAAHTTDDIDRTLRAAEAALREALRP